MYKDFYNNFNEEEKQKLKIFFNNLSTKIDLNKKDSRLVIGDFQKAILYFYKEENKSIDIILKRLSLDNLGVCYKEEPIHWFALDNAAKIYPLSMKKNWMSVYRLSCYLKEEINPIIFQMALTFTMKRFPTFRTSIRKGFFWYYIDGIKKRFAIKEENNIPCSRINVSNIGKISFRAVYYKNRISIEFFHILTDGTGGLTFLLAVVATYLKLMGKKVTYNSLVLDTNLLPDDRELKDEFVSISSPLKGKGLIEKKALQIDGKLSKIRPCQILHFDMNVDEIKKLAKEKNTSITELLLGFIYLTLSFNTSKRGNIKVQVPVNMRKYYPSVTLRNFAMYATVSIPREEIRDLDSVILEIKRQLREMNTKEEMTRMIKHSGRLVNSLKFIPLFIKRPLAKFIYGYIGDKSLTTVLSNLGNVDIPADLKLDIIKLDFVLGTSICNRVQFSSITCGNTLCLSISKFTLNKSVENSLYNILLQNGIKVDVRGSEVYEY